MRSDRSLDEELALALRLVDAASALALDFYHRDMVTEHKSDGTPITAADLEVERQLLDALATERPDDSVLGEETGVHGASPWRWIIDPIDGTFNFVKRQPEWGTHLALEHDGEIVVGVIARPVLERRWWASRGGGAYRGGANASDRVRLRVSTVASLRDSRVSLWTRARHNGLEQGAIRVSPALNDILRLVAGELEAVIDPGGKPWDHAPAVVLVEEAGGRFEDGRGGHRIDVGEGRYTNGRIDAELRRVLAA